MELVGFPPAGSMGLLVGGGWMASLIGLTAARRGVAAARGWNVRDDGLQAGHPPLMLYVAEEGHSCLRKAAELLGLGAASIRTIPVDADFRMSVPALRDAVTADRAAGRVPACVAASAGTVSTGAVDPLDALADICAEHGLWFHVDGAYGGLGLLRPPPAARYTGLGRADSLALDPHQWLSVPIECGAVVVRDGVVLREAFSLVPPYLRAEEGKGFGGLPWFSEYGPEQTRGLRALQLWMGLQHLGPRGVGPLEGH